MKNWWIIATVALAALVPRADASPEEWLEDAGRQMRFGLWNNTVVGQFSGMVDLEGYYVEQPALGLLRETGNFLFAPRFSVGLDMQITPAIYISAELRVDRGFDPSERNIEARMDEYAIAWHPVADIPVELKAGKFASVVGTYSSRYQSWTNPFITAPLPYENLTSVWDDYAASSPAQLVFWRFDTEDRYLGVPIIWGPDYASGFAISGRARWFTFDGEVKNASLSSRPQAWDFDSHFLDHPTWSGRVGWEPSPLWKLGVAGSVGPYLRPGAGVFEPGPVVPRGTGLSDFREITIAQDLTFEWRHWQLWAEAFETRFEVPRVGNADTLAYYLEGRYKFTPQLFGAVRWNQQFFSEIPLGDGRFEKWGNDIWRVDIAMTYRWTPTIQTKLQYSFADQTLTARKEEHLVAAQFTVRY